MRIGQPPPAFVIAVRAAEPADDGQAIRLSRGVIEMHGGMPKDAMAVAGRFVDMLLSDPDIPNADLKGLLKRTAGPAWGVEFEFGADAKAARRYLEALSRAIAQELI